jgi:hypothetical protein
LRGRCEVKITRRKKRKKSKTKENTSIMKAKNQR